MWKKYDSHASLLAMDGALHITVIKERNGWCACIRSSLGDGHLFPVQGAKSIDDAISKTNQWLMDKIEEVGRAIYMFEYAGDDDEDRPTGS